MLGRNNSGGWYVRKIVRILMRTNLHVARNMRQTDPDVDTAAPSNVSRVSPYMSMHMS